jgi:hypothetical protein
MVLGRIVPISMVSAILDVILHALLAPTYNYDYPPSCFVASGLFKPAAGIAFEMLFYSITLQHLRYPRES